MWIAGDWTQELVGIGDWINTRYRLGPFYGITVERSGYRVLLAACLFSLLLVPVSTAFPAQLPSSVDSFSCFVIFHNECIMHYFFLFSVAFVCHAVRTESSWVRIIVLFARSCLRRSLGNKLRLMMDNKPNWPLTWNGRLYIWLSLRSYKPQQSMQQNSPALEVLETISKILSLTFAVLLVIDSIRGALRENVNKLIRTNCDTLDPLSSCFKIYSCPFYVVSIL